MPKDKEYQKRYEATREKLKKFAVANDYKAMVDYIIEINDETTAENTPECQSMLDFIERNTVIEDSEYEGQDAVREDLVINLGRELQSRLVQYTAELHESLERTKQKVNSGSIPGTELLTDDDPKLKENISYAVFMGSQKFQKLRNVHAVFGHMTTALDMKNSADYVKDLITKKISPYEKEVREKYTTPDKLTGKPIVSVEDLKKDNSYYNSGTVPITKCKGFYVNYNNLDGKHIFDKLPDDIQKISAANNIDELEKLKKGYIAEKEQLEMQENADKDKLAELNTSIARTNKAEARMFMKKDIAIFDKKINVIDNYMDKVSELHAEMKDDIKYILEDYEKRKKNKEEISPEYTAYAKSLKNLDYVFNDADNVNAEELFKSLEQVQKASNTYASTHKGGLSFKEVKGEGLKRADSSRHINKLLDDKLSDLEKAAQAVPPKESMNEKYSIRVPPRKNGAYSVPSGVRTIAASAFKCSDIDEISFPDTLETIENNTFVAAQSLSSVVLPSSVSTVGYRAFAAGTFGSYMFKANIKEITFYNPMCEIGSSVILNSYIQENSRTNSVYTGKIKGYNGSTAQAYAEANGITFESLGESPIPLTTTSATVTTAASASTEPVTTTETTPIDYDLGDVNEDGVVDAKDASTILVAYAKASTGSEDGLTEQQRSVSDVDNDVKVDAKDASSILAYYAMASTASGDVPSLKEYMTGKTS